MGKKIRLLALDLDGTLLNGAKQITPGPRRRWAGQAAGGSDGACDRPPGPGSAAGGAVPAGAAVRGHLQRGHHSGPGGAAGAAGKASGPCPLLAGAGPVRPHSHDPAGVPGGVGYLSRPDYETLRARYAGTAMLQYHLDTRQVLPGTVEEFLAADARPVEELFFLTDSPQTKQALRQCLADLPGIGFADPFPNDLEVIAGGD